MRYSEPNNSVRTVAPDRCFMQHCERDAAVHAGHGRRICEWHADNIWREVERRDAASCHVEMAGREARDYDRAEARAKRAVEQRKPTAVGEIYFVQVDELVKVGWTTKLFDRVRAYGPKAVLLANYPGTRADEAALHRQLTPARFRGREWYSDSDVIRAFVAEAVAKYGPPRFTDVGWGAPKAATIRPKSRR